MNKRLSVIIDEKRDVITALIFIISKKTKNILWKNTYNKINEMVYV